MRTIGLTGGIGSGKSTVAKMFAELGVPVYIADDAGKYLLATSKIVRRKMILLLGEECYVDDAPNKPYISNIIFNDSEKLAAVNAIIHPKVAQHFKRWMKKQDAAYCIKEAAILFENGGYTKCDYTILVTAPLDVRITRVQKRDQATREQVISRMNNQWSDAKKTTLADFVIVNTNLDSTLAEVIILHKKLMKT
jgi:dephospho-CoA kinase